MLCVRFASCAALIVQKLPAARPPALREAVDRRPVSAEDAATGAT